MPIAFPRLRLHVLVAVRIRKIRKREPTMWDEEWEGCGEEKKHDARALTRLACGPRTLTCPAVITRPALRQGGPEYQRHRPLCEGPNISTIAETRVHLPRPLPTQKRVLLLCCITSDPASLRMDVSFAVRAHAKLMVLALPAPCALLLPYHHPQRPSSVVGYSGLYTIGVESQCTKRVWLCNPHTSDYLFLKPILFC